MTDELNHSDAEKMSADELEEQCRKLEDAYGNALCDNANYQALNRIWKRIQELRRQLGEMH